MRWSQYWFQHKVIPLIVIGGLIFVNFFILVSEKNSLSDSGNDYVSSWFFLKIKFKSNF